MRSDREVSECAHAQSSGLRDRERVLGENLTRRAHSSELQFLRPSLYIPNVGISVTFFCYFLRKGHIWLAAI